MDLKEQRITCLRMAIDMGCKPDAVIPTATELMNFVTGGTAPPPATVAEPQAPATDAIAACGTALPASEAADLALAQPADGSDPGVSEGDAQAALPVEAEVAPAAEPQAATPALDGEREAPVEVSVAAAQAVEPEAVTTEPGSEPAEAEPVEAAPAAAPAEPAPVATEAVVEVPSPASEAVVETTAAPVAVEPAPMVADGSPAPEAPEVPEAGQVPAPEQGAAPAEDTPASVASDLPAPPPTAPNGSAQGEATSAAATAS
jgi:hypothetical protein